MEQQTVGHLLIVVEVLSQQHSVHHLQLQVHHQQVTMVVTHQQPTSIIIIIIINSIIIVIINRIINSIIIIININFEYLGNVTLVGFENALAGRTCHVRG